MLLQFSVILLLLKYGKSQVDKTETISVITNFLNIQQIPTKIFAMLCWDKRNSKYHSYEFYENNKNNISANTNLLLRKLSEKHLINLQTEIPNFFFTDHQTFLLDLACDNANGFLEMASQLHLFSEYYRWIVLGNRSDLRNASNLEIGSTVWLLERENTSLEIKSVYKHEGNWIEDRFASWNGDHFSEYHEYSIGKNRSNLKGIPITMSYVITNMDSLNHMWDYRQKHIDVVTKVNYILIHYLMDYINATLQFIMQPTWGYKNATAGIFSGMMGDLQLKRADIGGTGSFITTDRLEVVDFLDSSPTSTRIILRVPPLSYTSNIFTLPFDKTVWYSCFALIPLIALVFLAVVKWEQSDPVFSKKIENERLVLRPRDVIMAELGAVTQQGTDVEPKSNAGRIVTIFTLVAFMFLYTSYTASIVALLQSTTKSIRNLEDLLHSRIQVGANDISYAHYYFETATDPIRKAIYEQKVAPKGQKPNFMPAEEGIRRVRAGFFGFYVEPTTGYQLVSETFQESEKCSLREIEFLNMMEPWMPYQRNSSYKEIMKIGIRRIREVGVKKREFRRLYVSKPACISGGSNFGSVGLVDCYSAFLIYAIGAMVSVLLLVLEIGMNEWTLRKK